MDCSPPGSSVHGISQARILEWEAISFIRRSSWPRDQTHVSRIGRWILHHWATRVALYTSNKHLKNKLHNSIITPRDTSKELCEINLHRNCKILGEINLYIPCNLRILVHFAHTFALHTHLHTHLHFTHTYAHVCVKMNMLSLIFI